MNKEKTKGFISGFTTAIVISSLTITAFAAPVRKAIEVAYNDIKLVVDGKKIEFGKDSSGKKIEPFIYDGTTYLPVGTVGKAVGKSVAWDGKTQTVYLGEKPGDVQYMVDVIEPYANDDWVLYTTESLKKFDMGGKSYNGYVARATSSVPYMMFNLDGKYTEISGALGSVRWTVLKASRDVNILLDGKLYKTIEVKNNELPQNITIPVSGVLQMKIEVASDSTIPNWGTSLGFGDVTIR